MAVGREITLFEHGFVRLDAAMASDLSVANAARVSFAKRKEALDEADEGLIRFLMRDRHGTPFEHNAFRFHVRCPLFVAREWFRHRIGCLTGDTVVTFLDTNGRAPEARRTTIAELWSLWSKGERSGQGLTADAEPQSDRPAVRGTLVEAAATVRDARARVRRMKLRVLNEETNEFEIGHIAEVVDQGVQPVYRVGLADGKQLTMTASHRVLTSAGWRTLAEAVGLAGDGAHARATRDCSLLVNGLPVHRDAGWMRSRRERGRSVRQIADVAGCGRHAVGAWLGRLGLQLAPGERSSGPGHASPNRGGRGHGLHRMRADERPRTPGGRRSARPSSFRRGGGSSGRSAIGRWTTEPAAAAHREHDPRCRAPGRARRGVRVTARPVPVVSVEYAGLKQTYDLCVDGPWHNFVANGVVVHNSFNEESARYHALEGDFYVPAPSDVRSQVGKPGAYTFEPAPADVAEGVRIDLSEHYERSYRLYRELIDRGLAKELARCALPMGTFTQFYWTVNARSLMNFISLRAAGTAQLEIRRYAEAVEELFAELMPVTHAAFVANDRTAP